MIYLDIMIYNCSWGPMPWAYVPEIFPTRIRAMGLAVSMLAHWATSFCFSFASPYMIANIGPNTFFIFMAFDVLATIFCFFFVRETRGQNLEHAAGTEWEVAEKLAGDPERGEGYGEGLPVGPGAAIVHGDVRGAGEILGIDEKTGREVHVVNVHDTFNTSRLKRRS